MGSRSFVAEKQETSQGYVIEIKKPTTRYLDEFLRIKCSPDLLIMKLFPNSKEITESMATFQAVTKYLRAENFGDPGITLIDVGCGATPRTAALFAYRTKWDCHAVDPNLHLKSRWESIDHLTCHKKRIEEVNFSCGGLCVVTAVHSHVKLDLTLKSITAPRIVVIAMPCCVPLELDTPPKVEYEDWGIWSPHRTVKIYDTERSRDGQQESH